MSDDPYVYPGTEVLRNHFDIDDKDNLDTVERIVSDAAMRRPLNEKTPMDAKGFQQLHKHIFGKVYPWAGEFRSVDLAKGDSYFCRPDYIKGQMNERFDKLQQDNYLKDLSRHNFARKAAVHIAELNAIHPFREGNGRTTRLFLEHLAKQAGHTLDQRLIDPQNWHDASVDSFKYGDYDKLASEIELSIIDPEKQRTMTDPQQARLENETALYKAQAERAKSNPVLQKLREQDRNNDEREQDSYDDEHDR